MSSTDRWKISAGTACCLGKSKAKTDVLPTTGYLMIGERCRNHCQFCAQAQESDARADALSRVTWPQFPSEEIAQGLSDAYQAGQLQRTCLQVVGSVASDEQALQAIESIRKNNAMPLCVSSHFETIQQAGALLSAGADRICIALDAATPTIYQKVKKNDWTAKWQLLTSCAIAFPGKITTHLIVGLGESEAEMTLRIAECLQMGVSVGLFAFTPVRGTPLAAQAAPEMASYRRIQMAHWLLRQGYNSQKIRFSQDRIEAFDIAEQEFINLYASGKTFETSGCSDCNRPYYNERPGQIPYNYPRPLLPEEVKQAVLTSGMGGI